MREKSCVYCKQKFVPSARNPYQRACGSPDCQRRRRADYHRRKLLTDPVYREQCRDSRKKWRENNPHYMKRYRARHRFADCGDAERAYLSKELRRLEALVRTNSVPGLRCYRTREFLIWRLDGCAELLKRRCRDQLCVVCWSAPQGGVPQRKVGKKQDRNARPWSEEEDRFLFNLAGFMELRVIAGFLHRAANTVRTRVAILAKGRSHSKEA